jgi:hypothetical protein
MPDSRFILDTTSPLTAKQIVGAPEVRPADQNQEEAQSLWTLQQFSEINGKPWLALREHNLDGTIQRQYTGTTEEITALLEIAVKLSDWVFRSIEKKEVLTLHQDYFRLRKPIERRFYEIARKHRGKQESWRISLELLKLKCGSHSPLKGFRHDIKELATGTRWAVSLSTRVVVYAYKRYRTPRVVRIDHGVLFYAFTRIAVGLCMSLQRVFFCISP